MRCTTTWEFRSIRDGRSFSLPFIHRCGLILMYLNRSRERNEERLLDLYDGICLEEVTMAVDCEMDRHGKCWRVPHEQTV